MCWLAMQVLRWTERVQGDRTGSVNGQRQGMQNVMLKNQRSSTLGEECRRLKSELGDKLC